MKDKMSQSLLVNYAAFLRREERSENTICKYIRDITAFLSHQSVQKISKETVLAWKEELTKHHAPASVNSMLAAVNSFLCWFGKPECKVKPIKIQRAVFAKPEKELTRAEYLRLVQTADHQQNRRLAMLLQTICATGIRVSELKFITVNAVRTGCAVVDCKGKTRTIFLPKDLCRGLVKYCREQGIDKGLVFRTKSGKPLDRSNIWREMRALCESANVEPGKVFPHNLRHLFARTYYSLEKDLSRLADILGHSNISTTRIYTMETGIEHAKQIDRMRLVLV